MRCAGGAALHALHKISNIKMQNNLLTRINTWRNGKVYTQGKDDNFVYFILDLNNNTLSCAAEATVTHSLECTNS